MGKLNVLVVDDDPGCRITVMHNLMIKGMNVVLAMNGADALAILESARTKFTAILLDLRMPVMDGVEFLRRYKGEEPVILISGNSEFEDLPRPVHAFVPKPIDISALVDMIRGLGAPNPWGLPAEQ